MRSEMTRVAKKREYGGHVILRLCLQEYGSRLGGFMPEMRAAGGEKMGRQITQWFVSVFGIHNEERRFRKRAAFYPNQVIPSAGMQHIRLLPVIMVVFVMSFIFPIIKDGEGRYPHRLTAAEELFTLLRNEMYPIFGWCALSLNVPFCVGVCCLAFQRWTLSRLFASLAVGLALAVPITVNFIGPWPDDHLVLCSGYYLWLSCMALLLLASGFKLR